MHSSEFWNNPDAKKTLKALKIFLVVAGIILPGIWLGFFIMFLWNATMASIFSLPTITYWEAVGLFFLAKLFFGFGDGGSHSSKSHKSRDILQNNLVTSISLQTKRSRNSGKEKEKKRMQLIWQQKTQLKHQKSRNSSPIRILLTIPYSSTRFQEGSKNTDLCGPWTAELLSGSSDIRPIEHLFLIHTTNYCSLTLKKIILLALILRSPWSLLLIPDLTRDFF